MLIKILTTMVIKALKDQMLARLSCWKALFAAATRCVISALCALRSDIVTAANSAFQQLRRAIIWSSRALTLSVKTQFFQCIVMSMLLYSEESWTVVGHISPLAVLQMNCLQRICGISLRDHVPNVDTLNRCNPLSVESQLQGRRLRWLGHVFSMPNNMLPEKLLFDEVMGLCPAGRPRSNFNDVASRDCQNCQIGRPHTDAQGRLLWRDKTCPVHIWLITSWKATFFFFLILL